MKNKLLLEEAKNAISHVRSKLFFGSNHERDEEITDVIRLYAQRTAITLAGALNLMAEDTSSEASFIKINSASVIVSAVA